MPDAAMIPDPEADTIAWLRRAGLAAADEVPVMTPLTGGVSSDVHRVDLRRGPICVKRAIGKLRVASDWRAPVVRSDYEVAWMRAVGAVAPDMVPEVLAQDTEASRFAMTWFPPELFPVWKSQLVAGRLSPEFPAQVALALVGMHAAAAGSRELAERFATDELFEALRLEPYLRATAAAHPDLAEQIGQIAARTQGSKLTLIHGDVSPKNILEGPKGPVFLDAECAWFGDPAFDVGFCCAHLLLKALWLRDARMPLLAAFEAFREGYLAGVSWEPAEALDARAGPLLAALLLARIDGKSPIDYLNEPQRAFVRALARKALRRSGLTLSEVGELWRELLVRGCAVEELL